MIWSVISVVLSTQISDLHVTGHKCPVSEMWGPGVFTYKVSIIMSLLPILVASYWSVYAAWSTLIGRVQSTVHFITVQGPTCLTSDQSVDDELNNPWVHICHCINLGKVSKKGYKGNKIKYFSKNFWVFKGYFDFWKNTKRHY